MFANSLFGRRPRRNGFSLIDVMISIVVLATGMLAVAALQANLTRAVAEARSRTQATTLANGVLDALKASIDKTQANYQSLAGDTKADGGSWTSGGTWKSLVNDASLTSPASGTYDESFAVNVEVSRFIRERSESICGAGNTPCFRPAIISDDPDTEETEVIDPADSDGAEFKRVNVAIGWTNAWGEKQEIAVSDIVSSLSSTNSDLVVEKSISGSPAGGPRVLMPTPDEDGVIPIAVGTDDYGRDESTAATNPKPIVLDSTATGGTRFNVLTYAAVNSSSVEVQRKIETQVVGCKCTFGAPPATASEFEETAVRPVYWTGTSYASPEIAEDVGITVPASWGASSTSQSPLCDDCCRDHHDPAGIAADEPKFAPKRATHSHFDADGKVITSGSYNEVCRFIRVDGLWRVASDARLQHMSLLETEDSAKSWVPTTAGTKNYQEFVKAFLADLVIPVSAEGSASAATLEVTHKLNVPTSLSMLPTTGDTRYLHARGLYLDYLEPSAQAYLSSKLSGCPAATSDIDCLLPYLPFVSVNTTELARYSRESGEDDIQISNGSLDSDIGQPDRGFITPTASAADKDEAKALVAMTRENSGLTDGFPVVDPAEGLAASTMTDSQAVVFSIDADEDSDGDGIPDPVDNCDDVASSDTTDLDGDGEGNPCDSDDDGDGVSDVNDNDQDGDGVGNETDPDLDGDGIPNVSDNDMDGDGKNNDVDTDADGDGFKSPDAFGVADNCPLAWQSGQNDTDGDGAGDACDSTDDQDGDGVLDGKDNCPNVSNATQEDLDADGIGDACEVADADGDSIPDSSDNCPATANPDQTDTDGDAIGDACDAVVQVPVDFSVTISIAGVNLSTVSPKPVVEWGDGPTGCPGTVSGSDADPNDYECDDASGPEISLVFGKYNRLETSGAKKDEVNNPCASADINLPKGPKKIFPATCYNYKLASVEVDGVAAAVGAAAVVNAGSDAEATTTVVSGVVQGTKVTADFTLQNTTNLLTTAGGYVCSSTVNEPAYDTSKCQP